MDVLRIQMAGTVTSFRHPLFPHGDQPTYPFPPPATLFGLVCSVLGQVVSPDEMRLACQFQHEGRFTDLEHVYLVGAKGQGVKLSPFDRHLLYQPRLTLYLDRPEWERAFRSPHYVVTLGRSQDLMTITDVRVVTLAEQPTAYVQHTLLQAPVLDGVRQYTGWQMPRRLTPQRHVLWQTYAHVEAAQPVSDRCLTDPDAPLWRGLRQGVVWLNL